MKKNTPIVFFISSDGWGGLEMNVLKLQKWLLSEGYLITLYCCKGTKIHQFAVKDQLPFYLIDKPRKKLDFLHAFRFSQLFRKQQMGLVFIFQNYDLDVLSWCKYLFYPQLVLLYQQHMQIGIDKKDFIHTFRYKALSKWISPLHWLKEEVALRTRYPIDLVEVIPLGLDTQIYLQAKGTKTEALHSLGLSPQAPLLGIMGRISPKKGQDFVIRAIEKLNQEGLPVELLIVGSATVNDPLCQAYDQEIRAYVQNKDLHTKVHFIGHMDDPLKFYQAIDVFVMASHGETYGMVTIEAMLSGLPVAGTFSGGTPEILDQGNLGYLFEYENMDSFCDAIRHILKNPHESSKKAKLAQSIAAQKYSKQHEVQKICQLIQEL